MAIDKAIEAQEMDPNGSAENGLLQKEPSVTNGVVQIHSEETPPKHRPSSKCFRWGVVFCSFCIFSLASVTQITFGIFITELEEIFGLSRTMIGVIGAFRMSLSSMGGVVAGPLVPRLGCRMVAILGVIICAVGNFTAVFTTEPYTFMLTFGLLAGLGAGIAYLPAHVIVQEHFEGLKSRPIAMGIASSGLSISVMIFSPLTRILLNTFGWRGALLLITGHTLQLLVPAALLRPAGKPPASSPESGDAAVTREETPVEKSATSRRRHALSWCCSSVTSALESYFHPALAQRSFVLLLAACFTLMFGVDTIYMRSAARAIREGIDPLKAAFIVSASSPFSAFGRFTCGLMARIFNPRNIYGAGFVSMGAAVILSAFLAFDVFGMHVFFCCWFAISVGTTMGLQSTVVCDLVGLKQLPIAMAWVLFITGIGRTIANPFIGFMFDRTGAYTVPFVVSGILLILGGACVLSLICLDKTSPGSLHACVEDAEDCGTGVEKSATAETLLNSQGKDTDQVDKTQV